VRGEKATPLTKNNNQNPKGRQLGGGG